MKKWYKQPYFDRRIWLLENFEKLSLNSEEVVLLLLIDMCKQVKRPVSIEYLKEKMGIDQNRLDQLMAGLVTKHFLSISVNEKGVRYDIDGVFEFDPERYEIEERKGIFEQTAELLKRPLTPSELQKVSELTDRYGESRYIDALRTADAYRKNSLPYIETVLRNEKK